MGALECITVYGVGRLSLDAMYSMRSLLEDMFDIVVAKSLLGFLIMSLILLKRRTFSLSMLVQRSDKLYITVTFL